MYLQNTDIAAIARPKKNACLIITITHVLMQISDAQEEQLTDIWRF